MDSQDLVTIAEVTSKLAKTTAIYLARLGVDGTSGNHVFRGTQLELDLANAALDALKQKYGFEGFHFAGQSGGSKLAAALAVVRRDVGCAVLGSGRFDAPEVPKSKEPSHNYFDTTEHVAQLAQNHALRLYLVTDKADKRVPSAHQSGFADKLRRAGRAVPQYFVETTDELHHGTFQFTELVAAGCVLDRPEDEIAAALATQNKRNAEYNERRRKEADAKTAILAAARQSAPSPSVPSPSAAASGKK
jgi:pimeloyl-ACP methyl ester carboxylesterase